MKLFLPHMRMFVDPLVFATCFFPSVLLCAFACLDVVFSSGHLAPLGASTQRMGEPMMVAGAWSTTWEAEIGGGRMATGQGHGRVEEKPQAMRLGQECEASQGCARVGRAGRDQ